MSPARMTTGTRWHAPEGTVTIVAVREGIVVAMDEAGRTFREVRAFAERVWTPKEATASDAA